MNTVCVLLIIGLMSVLAQHLDYVQNALRAMQASWKCHDSSGGSCDRISDVLQLFINRPLLFTQSFH